MHVGNRAMRIASCAAPGWTIGAFSTPGAMRLVSIPDSPAADSATQAATNVLTATLLMEQSRFSARCLQEPGTIARPRWSAASAIPEGARESSVAIVEDGAGWPLLALSATRPAMESQVKSGLRHSALRWVLSSGNAIGIGDRVLPLRPIAPGFAINVVSFGALWLLAVESKRQIRKRVRVVSRRFVANSVVVCVVAGLISTICVAWWIALNVPLDAPFQVGRTERAAGGMPWIVRKSDAGIALRLQSDRYQNGWQTVRSIPDPLALEVAGRWGEALRPHPDPGITKVIDARGWPMLAMWGEMSVRSTKIGYWRLRSLPGECGSQTRNQVYRRDLEGSRFASVLSVYGSPSPLEGLELDCGHENDRSLQVHYTRVVPWRPLWPGFAVNSVVFGTGWLVLLCIFLGPGFFVQSHRAQIGRCVRCGYDLRDCGGVQCSECGTAIAGDAIAAG